MALKATNDAHVVSTSMDRRMVVTASKYQGNSENGVKDPTGMMVDYKSIAIRTWFI